jgi:opacity protein-like surface antigen
MIDGCRYRRALECRRAVRAACAVFIAFAATFATGPARAADWLGEPPLRGALSGVPVRWEGVYLGGSYGYSRMNVDFSGAVDSLSANGIDLPNQSGQFNSYGGFLGYNTNWENVLILGVEGTYNHLSSDLTVSRSDSATSGSTTYDASSSVTLQDYGAIRGRVGYAFGQFLPYVALGVAVGRFKYATYATSTTSGTTTVVINDPNDNAWGAGLDAGLGIDVALAPNIFLRGEYEYVLFAPIGDIKTQLNTARAGIAVRF